MTPNAREPDTYAKLAAPFDSTFHDNRGGVELDWQSKPCRLWTGSRTREGYGRINRAGAAENYIHRQTWVDARGAIPEGLKVLHRCDNPPCYEIAHLFLGTQLENIHDRDAKGRMSRRGNPKTTLEERREIAGLYATGASPTKIGARFGVSRSRVWQIGRAA